jgi:hypothetical protein
MAAPDAFSTLPAELADMVFSLLPFEDILTCHQVSRQWYDWLKEGHAVSRRLFRYRESMRLSTDATKIVFLKSTWNKTVAESKNLSVHCNFHPLFGRIFTSRLSTRTRNFVDVSIPGRELTMRLGRPDFWKVLGTRDKKPNPEAPWRHMFITHSPVQRVLMKLEIPRDQKCWVWLRSMAEDLSLPIALDNAHGVTWNEVFFAIATKANRFGPKWLDMQKWADVAPQTWMTHVPSYMKVTVRPVSSDLMHFPTEKEIEEMLKGHMAAEDDEST